MGVIRLLLAISVVMAHAGPVFGISLVGGQVAVQAFYIISGFYMTLVLNEKYIGKNNSYKLFISNRFLRLYPIYWVVLLMTVGLSLLTGIWTHGEYWLKFQPFVNHYQDLSISSFMYLLFANIFLVGQDWIMFMGLNTANGQFFFTTNFWETEPQLWSFLFVSQAWTIGVEITFYLIAPFLVRRKPLVIIGIILLSLFIRLILVNKGLDQDPWSYRFFPNEILFFMLGNLSYRMYKKIELATINTRYLSGVLGFLILSTLFYNSIDFSFKMQTYLFVFFLILPFIFKLTKKNKMDQWIGDLSYPVYLSHMLFILVIAKLQPLVNILGKGLTVTILAILISILLNKYVAKPIENLRQNRVKLRTQAV